MTENAVYLDNNATTQVAPEVAEAMLPYLSDQYGNPSSPHGFARPAALAIDDARKAAASLVGCEPGRIYFTSGGTESNAMALLGCLEKQKPRDEIIISAVEHAAIWGWRDRLTSMGYMVRVIGVDGSGALDMDALIDALSERTALVSVMLANNETGVLLPVAGVASAAHKVGALVHSDTVQAIGKIPVNLTDLGVDFASSSAHKHNGPKGSGFLYSVDHKLLTSITMGGEQESGVRPGTEAVHQIAGLGSAAKLSEIWLASDGPERLKSMRDRFEARLLEAVDGVMIAGVGQPRLPNTTLALIDGVETEPLLALLDMKGIACSSGSACSSGAHEASHVLKAMGIDRDFGGRERTVLRVSSGRYTTQADYDRLSDVLPSIVDRLR